MRLYIRVYMIVDLKVNVEIVHYKGRQGSNMRPREKFVWVRVFFFARVLGQMGQVQDVMTC